MTSEDLNKSFNRLLEENSGYNRRIQNIINELNRNSISSGLSELQAIKTLINKCEEQEKTIIELNKKLLLLQTKLSNSRQTFLNELLKELDKKGLSDAT